MQKTVSSHSRRTVTARSVVARIATGMAVDLFLIAFFCEVDWVFLTPFRNQIQHVLTQLDPAYVEVTILSLVLCLVLCVVAIQLCHVRLVLMHMAWRFVQAHRDLTGN